MEWALIHISHVAEVNPALHLDAACSEPLACPLALDILCLETSFLAQQ